jgi:hypothetical protein
VGSDGGDGGEGYVAGGADGSSAGASGRGVTTMQLKVGDGGRVTVVGKRKAGVAAAMVDLLPVDVVADTAEHLAAAGSSARVLLKKAKKGARGVAAGMGVGPKRPIGSEPSREGGM